MYGLRPRKEIEAVVKKAINLQAEDPRGKYKIGARIAIGGQGDIYKAQRKSDGLTYVIKKTQGKTENLRQ